MFFEKNAITVTIKIGSNEVVKLNEHLKDFLPKTIKLWETRYPCGTGGWIHYRTLNDKQINDTLKLIETKRNEVYT